MEITIIYDFGCSKNLVKTVNNVDDLKTMITDLQNEGCNNISIECDDNTYWIAEYPIEEIINCIL